MTRVVALPHLDAANYERSTLHSPDRAWVEKNCYVDIWIETIHAVGLDPVAMLPFTIAIDFEGDQWTFFKPKHDELRALYGLDVQELNVWRKLSDHVITHVGQGALLSTEADAFYLPDTAGTDYKTQHTKTTIVIQDFDLENRRMGYFHNAGYFSVDGDDFVRLFRVDYPYDPTFMPLFAETIRLDRIVKRPKAELVEMSRELVKKHLALAPKQNPVIRFGERFATDLPSIQAAGLPHYHAWAFATTRQLGAAFELAAANLEWLGDPKLAPAVAAFNRISQTSKAFILKAARAVNSKKPYDAAATFSELATAWDEGMTVLSANFGA